MGIATLTIINSAQYYYSHSAPWRMLNSGVSFTFRCIVSSYVGLISAVRSSTNIVKIMCTVDASNISQSVVQIADDFGIGRTAWWIAMNILFSSSLGVTIKLIEYICHNIREFMRRLQVATRYGLLNTIQSTP
ncbi:hypothetical protein NPIL_618701 [Nephila pilipes]|uniref:Uncharacterized protein n=1 Tax=Nephila pilipes TaxID=299642 RepID=A0A8X6QCX2_NEPPI|nr:hypothetical protein NPIL_618701 [Nephila pilipes]